MVKLIVAQNNLNEDQFCLKHADTIQHLQIYWKPVTKILSYLVNLVSLDLNLDPNNPMGLNSHTKWSHLEMYLYLT